MHPDRTAPRRDPRKWERIEMGLWRQAGTDRYKSCVSEYGVERRMHFEARNLTEAKQRHEKRRVNVREGVEPEPTKITMDENAEDFFSMFEGLVATGERAPTTLERYKLQYAKHLKPTLGRMRVQALGTEHASRWISELRKSGLSDSSVASLYRLLSVLLEHALSRGLIVESPLKRISKRERPKQKAKPRRRLSDDECGKLIAEAPEGLRVLTALISFTGMRQSEALGQIWEDVDFENERICVRYQLERKKRGEPVRRGPLKSDNGLREIELLPELASILKRHKAEAFACGQAGSAHFVFCTKSGQPYYFRNVTRDLFDEDGAADRAGLNREGLPKVTTHSLRHTAISRWIAAGLDVVEVARQAGDTVETISKVYAGEFDRAKRRDSIRERLAAGTSIKLG